MKDFRCGIGCDVHAFAPDRRLVLGGVEIEYHLGLAGHSDADVLIHAVIDALFGAAGLGDIGRHFPDTDPRYRDISSLVLLEAALEKLAENGWSVGNIDVSIIAEKPKLAGYIDQIRDSLAGSMKLEKDRINIKATTTERLGFTGREEGVAAMAVALILK